MRHLIALAAITGLLTTGCGDRQQSPPAGQPSVTSRADQQGAKVQDSTIPGDVLAIAGQPYYDTVHEFSITFPGGWTLKRSSNPETLIKAVYADSRDRIAQITVAAYLLPSAVSEREANELSPDDMWQGLIEQFPDFTVKRHDRGMTKIRSHRAVWNLVEISDPPQARSIAKYYHLVRGATLFRITAVTDSGAAFFQQVLPVMEESIGTLAFGL